MNFNVWQFDKIENKNRTLIKIYVILDKSQKNQLDILKSLLQEMSEFFLWNLIIFHPSTTIVVKYGNNTATMG